MRVSSYSGPVAVYGIVLSKCNQMISVHVCALSYGVLFKPDRSRRFDYRAATTAATPATMSIMPLT
jgi:hypothetical protein